MIHHGIKLHVGIKLLHLLTLLHLAHSPNFNEEPLWCQGFRPSAGQVHRAHVSPHTTHVPLHNACTYGGSTCSRQRKISSPLLPRHAAALCVYTLMCVSGGRGEDLLMVCAQQTWWSLHNRHGATRHAALSRSLSVTRATRFTSMKAIRECTDSHARLMCRSRACRC